MASVTAGEVLGVRAPAVGETVRLPVMMLDSTGAVLTGQTWDAAGMSVAYAKEGESAFSAFPTFATENWDEIGYGLYVVILRQSDAGELALLDTPGHLYLYVKNTASRGDTSVFKVNTADATREDVWTDARGAALPSTVPGSPGGLGVLDANSLLDVDVKRIVAGAITEAAGAGKVAGALSKLLDVATPTLVASDAMRGTDGAELSGAAAAAVAGLGDVATQGDLDALETHGDSAWATAVGFAVPGSAMTLTTGERTSIGTAVWAATTRTLTAATNITADIATAVWAYATRTITSISSLLAGIADAVWDEPRAGHTTADTFGDDFATSTLVAQLGAITTIAGPSASETNVTWCEGDSAPWARTLQDSEGTAYNLTGKTVYLGIDKAQDTAYTSATVQCSSAPGGEIAIDADPTTGKIVVTFTAGHVAALTRGTWWYTISTATSTLVRGEFEVVWALRP